VNAALHAIALAGIAAGAYAQTTGNISFNAPSQAVAGETFTVEVIASGDQAGILSFNLAISITGPAAVVGMPSGNPTLFTFATFDGVGAFEVSGGANAFAKQQLPNGSVLFSFQMTLLAPRPVTLSASAGTIDGGGAGTLTYGTDTGVFLLPTDFDEVMFNDYCICIPTPGAAAPLALAGLVAARRRR
jgi:hypothetical protein